MTVNQHKMLQLFGTSINSGITIEQAKKLDRRTFDCLCRRRWLQAKYDRRTNKYVFVLSNEGSTWLDFARHIKVYKLIPSEELSKFAYALTDSKVMHKMYPARHLARTRIKGSKGKGSKNISAIPVIRIMSK